MHGEAVHHYGNVVTSMQGKGCALSQARRQGREPRTADWAVPEGMPAGVTHDIGAALASRGCFLLGGHELPCTIEINVAPLQHNAPRTHYASPWPPALPPPQPPGRATTHPACRTCSRCRSCCRRRRHRSHRCRRRPPPVRSGWRTTGPAHPPAGPGRPGRRSRPFRLRPRPPWWGSHAPSGL